MTIEWFPIDTAPFDRPILMGSYSSEPLWDGFLLPGWQWIGSGWIDREEMRLSFSLADGGTGDKLSNLPEGDLPTHWAPMPSPPVTEDKQ